MRASWWRGAAIYEIYPRSFLDTNGDSVGDLRAITQRHWRRRQPVLRLGDIRFIDVPEPALAFVRSHEHMDMLVAFNLSCESMEVVLNERGEWRAIDVPGIANGRVAGHMLQLPPHGACYAMHL